MDLGCGPSSLYAGLWAGTFSLGLEVHQPAIREAQKEGTHDQWILADVSEIPLKEKSFDCVIMLDLIEHLEKGVGMAVIRGAEQLARKRVVLGTPNGLLPQEAHHGNPYQSHKSGWTVGELRRMGYVVRGLGGFKGIRGERSEIHHRPAPLWVGAALLTGPLTYYWPRLAGLLFGVKEIA